jgi:hypothetical protein
VTEADVARNGLQANSSVKDTARQDEVLSNPRGSCANGTEKGTLRQSFTELIFPELPRCGAEVSKLKDCQCIRFECEGQKRRRF